MDLVVRWVDGGQVTYEPEVVVYSLHAISPFCFRATLGPPFLNLPQLRSTSVILSPSRLSLERFQFYFRQVLVRVFRAFFLRSYVRIAMFPIGPDNGRAVIR